MNEQNEGGEADAPRLYGPATFGRSRCEGCNIEIQNCYLTPAALCSVCRPTPEEAQP